MTRYALDKVLWTYAREPGFKARFDADPGEAVGERGLSEPERAALEQRDFRAIIELGAHPFLLYAFAIAAHGGWSFDLMKTYVAQLEGVVLGDIET